MLENHRGPEGVDRIPSFETSSPSAVSLPEQVREQGLAATAAGHRGVGSGLDVRAPVEPATGRWSGRDLSSWPDPLLELVLRELGPADLALCRRVCRQWRRLAGNVELQGRAFMRTFPAFFRQRLEQGLDRDYCHQNLEPWCQALAPDSARRQQLESCVAQRLSSRALFFLQVEQMRAIPAFSALGCERLDDQNPLYRLVCSPNGRLLADARQAADAAAGSGHISYISLWYFDEEGVQRLFRERHDHPLQILSFSKDNRTLEAVDALGTQWVWQSEADKGPWRPVTKTRLYKRQVRQVELSTDGRYLALLSDDSVLVFTRQAQGIWKQQWCWCWRDVTGPEPLHDWPLVRPGPVGFCFSCHSQHLLMPLEDGLLCAFQTAAGWQPQVIERPRTTQEVRWRIDRPVLSLDESLLAVAFRPFDRSVAWHDGVHITLYGFTAGQGWAPITRRLCKDCRIEWPFPMVFSPDSQQLMLPQRQSRWNSSLYRLSDRSQPPWEEGLSLPVLDILDVVRREQSCVVNFVEFSGNGLFVAAVAQAGVRVWQHDLAHGWSSLAWIGHGSLGLCQAHFSPDAYHMALCVCDEGELSIWGLGFDGRFSRKVYLPHGVAVRLLGFTRDVSRVLFAVANPGQGLVEAARVTCLRLRPGETGFQNRSYCRLL